MVTVAGAGAHVTGTVTVTVTVSDTNTVMDTVALTVTATGQGKVTCDWYGFSYGDYYSFCCCYGYSSMSPTFPSASADGQVLIDRRGVSCHSCGYGYCYVRCQHQYQYR